jgi:protease I
MDELKGMKVAILITDGFEQVEMVQPRQALNEAGAITSIVSPKSQRVRSWNFVDWGTEFAVDVPVPRHYSKHLETVRVQETQGSKCWLTALCQASRLRLRFDC